MNHYIYISVVQILYMYIQFYIFHFHLGAVIYLLYRKFNGKCTSVVESKFNSDNCGYLDDSLRSSIYLNNHIELPKVYIIYVYSIFLLCISSSLTVKYRVFQKIYAQLHSLVQIIFIENVDLSWDVAFPIQEH